MIKLESMNKNYLIYYMQTVGIILVVLGHSFYQNMFNPLVHWIYSFHMPLFFFISGYLLQYTARGPLHRLNLWGCDGFIWKKAYRLLFPYVIISTLFFIPKICVNQLAARPVDASCQGYANMLLLPYSNVIGSFWFLPTLFGIYMVAMAVIRLSHILLKEKEIHPLVVIAALLAINMFIPINKLSVLNLSGIAHFMLYFATGFYFCRYQAEKIIEKQAWWIAPLTLVLSFLCFLPEANKSMLAFNGILMTTCFGMLYEQYHLRFLHHLYGATYTIYLLSFIPQFAVNQLLLHFVELPWQITTLLAFVLGIYIPYYIHRAMHRYCENPLMKLLTFITGQQSFQTKTKA